MATRVTSIRPAQPGLLQRFQQLVSNYPTAAFITSCVLVLNIIYPPNHFADYYQYLVITDGLWFFNTARWLDFEAGSNLLFVGLRLLTGNTETAVDIAHYLLGATFAILSFRFAQREEVGWRSLLAMFCLYGSLLAFVTIRATPAYLLVAFAALESSKGRWSAVALVAAATMFHVSAVLALPPILAGIAQNRLRALAWVSRSTWALGVAMALAGGVFVAFRSTLTVALGIVIAAVPFLGKYVVYTAALDPLNNAGPSGGGGSILHFIYLVVLSIFTAIMLLMPDERCRRFRSYLLVSYGVYLFLQFAPVTAYRQSQFWMIPAILIFPWQRFAPPGIMSVLFIVFSCAFLAFTIPGVVG